MLGWDREVSEAHRQEENISCPREIELVGSDHRNRGRREGGQLELPVEVSTANFPVAEGVFEMHGAFPGLRGLGKFAQIGDLGQVEVGQVVDQVCDMGCAGSVGHGEGSKCGKTGDFVSTVILLLVRGIINSNKKGYCAASVQPHGV